MDQSQAILAISVRNAQRKRRVDITSLRRFALAALALAMQTARERATELRGLEEINVLLVSDARIAGLHRRFMKIAGPTDVITFQHGEIFVSVETAQSYAREHGTSLDHELRLYIVHGILHLFGFDDKTERAARVMRRTQERIVAALS